MVEAEVGGTFVSQRFVTPVFGVGGTDDWNLDVAVRVGITDRLQVDVGTAFSLEHREHAGTGFDGLQIDTRPSLSSWQRVVPLRFSLLALDTRAVDTALALTLPFTAHAERTFLFRHGPDITFSNGDARVLPAVGLAAPTRLVVNDWLWLRAGEDLFAVRTRDGTARFAFELGLGLQPHPLFAVTLDSRIADVTFDGDGDGTSETVTDVGTIVLEGTFAPIRGLDVVGSFDLPDVGRGVDTYAVRSAVRVRF
jgi:hypothetical protein